MDIQTPHGVMVRFEMAYSFLPSQSRNRRSIAAGRSSIGIVLPIGLR